MADRDKVGTVGGGRDCEDEIVKRSLSIEFKRSYEFSNP